MRPLGALCSALFVVGITAFALPQDHRASVTGASVTVATSPPETGPGSSIAAGGRHPGHFSMR